ncbi:winged helix-turn-helix domain-containing protein [Actinoplanes sp. CA-030573]|uniref:winged helix-turn-helix domain-containing protein n=1 Tax=Actinoplanes sp. CA-030573 TaxID=3239898 RepID=UPI003D8E6399
MLRIHFTVADAMKVRVVVLGALAEVQQSFARLQQPAGQAFFDGWRSRTAARARRLSPDVREVARFVAPPGNGMADLFTLVGCAGEYAEGVDRLCGAPPAALRQELTCPLLAGAESPWLARIAGGDRAARQRLTRALGEYHAAAIAPYWPRIRTVLENERATRAEVMARHGVGAMLDGLAPALRWSPPTLEVPVHRSLHVPGGDLDVHLGGRGLVLAPSVFQAADPGLYLPWDDGPAMLIYAVGLDPATALRLWRDPGDDGDRAVASLLGSTRAAALRAATDGCTTSELARRLNISPGGASQHATVLRQAGLITSHRHRNTVRHTITHLGATLLDGA